MTEVEWLACAGPDAMLTFLRGQASSRKLRLFGVACCRRIWDWFEGRGRGPVEVIERHADGLAVGKELMDACREAEAGWIGEWGADLVWAAAYCLTRFEKTTAEEAAFATSLIISVNRGNSLEITSAEEAAIATAAAVAEATRVAARAFKFEEIGCDTYRSLSRSRRDQHDAACRAAGEAAWNAERYAQCYLLRDIFHGPRHAVFIRQHWRTWNGGTFVQLARGIYEGRAFEHLPILADALEEAGCHEPDILNHCRQNGLHVRGCWVLDALLGKG
jgi:hypothetical protein